MRLSKDKFYNVTKIYFNERPTEHFGILNGSEVRGVIGSAKYDEEYEMYFPKSANYAFDIVEA